MTSQDTSEATGANHALMVKEAALIANFYGKRGWLQPLIDHLVQSLALTPQGHYDYANEATGALMRHFDPPTASEHDTTIIQLALNRPGAAGAAWQSLRDQLEVVLPDDAILKNVWGYTLIYQAELAQDVPSEVALITLLPAVRRLHQERSECPQTLAQADMPGGRLWLIDIPVQGDGLQAATMYLALSQPNTNNRLVRNVLYNPTAALLMVDLVAHKGYYQMRQYRFDNLDEQYRQKMEQLRDHIDTLLRNLTQAAVTAGELDRLANEYGLLVSAVVHMDQLHVSLVRHEFNFHWWRKQAGGGDIVAFHQHQLEGASQELELLVTEGQQPLEAARTAVEMIRARLDKERERKQQLVATVFSAIATALSILVLIDKDVARTFLEFIGVRQPIGVWPVLLVQVICIAIASLLVMLLIRLIYAKRAK